MEDLVQAVLKDEAVFNLFSKTIQLHIQLNHVLGETRCMECGKTTPMSSLMTVQHETYCNTGVFQNILHQVAFREPEKFKRYIENQMADDLAEIAEQG